MPGSADTCRDRRRPGNSAAAPPSLRTMAQDVGEEVARCHVRVGVAGQEPSALVDLIVVVVPGLSSVGIPSAAGPFSFGGLQRAAES